MEKYDGDDQTDTVWTTVTYDTYEYNSDDTIDEIVEQKIDKWSLHKDGIIEELKKKVWVLEREKKELLSREGLGVFKPSEPFK